MDMLPGNECRLSTGKEFFAYGHILGIGPDGEIYTGYDETLFKNFTPAERAEVAAVMIERWRRWATEWATEEDC